MKMSMRRGQHASLLRALLAPTARFSQEHLGSASSMSVTPSPKLRAMMMARTRSG